MKKAFLIFLISVGLGVAGWCIYSQVYFPRTEKTIFKCHYVRYACGDCYPNWKIDSTGFSKSRNWLGLDIKVIYNEKIIDELLDSELSGCLICYDFYFTGILKSTLNKKYRFEADSYEYKLRYKDCCE